MEFQTTHLPGVILIHPRLFKDERGYFMETHHRQRFADADIDVDFVQDNQSYSHHGVLRGLHYQIHHPQGKLVRCLQGEIFDVAVDLRRSSPNFGKWWGGVLSSTNRNLVYIPPGFAHGFCVLSEEADVAYKCTDLYSPADERTIVWNDPAVGIEWPISSPLVSAKDQAGLSLTNADCFP